MPVLEEGGPYDVVIEAWDGNQPIERKHRPKPRAKGSTVLQYQVVEVQPNQAFTGQGDQDRILLSTYGQEVATQITSVSAQCEDTWWVYVAATLSTQPDFADGKLLADGKVWRIVSNAADCLHVTSLNGSGEPPLGACII
jgi:hypothetical protein